MTPTPGAAAGSCRVCQKAGARNGKRPNKYCDAPSCTQVGIDEGHITCGGKKQRAQSPAASSSPVSMPDSWQLLAIKGIFDCRCTRPAPCRIPPDAKPSARAPLSPRLCKLDSKDNIAQENGLISEEEMVASVEYLVLGHFKREERDEYGIRTMAWLSPADFDDSSTVSKQEVDAKLDEWETLGARVRTEARRLQREGATER